MYKSVNIISTYYVMYVDLWWARNCFGDANTVRWKDFQIYAWFNLILSHPWSIVLCLKRFSKRSFLIEFHFGIFSTSSVPCWKTKVNGFIGNRFLLNFKYGLLVYGWMPCSLKYPKWSLYVHKANLIRSPNIFRDKHKSSEQPGWNAQIPSSKACKNENVIA